MRKLENIGKMSGQGKLSHICESIGRLTTQERMACPSSRSDWCKFVKMLSAGRWVKMC